MLELFKISLILIAFSLFLHLKQMLKSKLGKRCRLTKNWTRENWFEFWFQFNLGRCDVFSRDRRTTLPFASFLMFFLNQRMMLSISVWLSHYSKPNCFYELELDTTHTYTKINSSHFLHKAKLSTYDHPIHHCKLCIVNSLSSPRNCLGQQSSHLYQPLATG